MAIESKITTIVGLTIESLKMKKIFKKKKEKYLKNLLLCRLFAAAASSTHNNDTVQM